MPLKLSQKIIFYGSWLIALAGLVGSLYYSEVRHLMPCLLCWYQRILLYPLVLLIPVGIIRRDVKLAHYVWPLSVLGLLVALYQVLLQAKIIPASLEPCANGISCAEAYPVIGFITIPMLSLAAFALISGLMLSSLRSKQV